MRYGAAIVAAMLAAGPGVATAGDIQAPAFDATVALRASQAAIGRRLSPDIILTDASGARRRLGDFRGRPLIVSPVYTSCFGICPTTTTTLREAVGILAPVVGPETFAVLTIGFDTAHDTPDRMREFARARGTFPANWTFAAADTENARRLLDGVGFTYAATARGFDHLIQATVVDADGVVVRQVYGQDFEPPLLVEPMKRLAIGRRAGEDTFGAMIEGVRLFCTVFDPKSGRYRFDWSIVLSCAIGVLCFTGVAVFLWRNRPRAR